MLSGPAGKVSERKLQPLKSKHEALNYKAHSCQDLGLRVNALRMHNVSRIEYYNPSRKPLSQTPCALSWVIAGYALKLAPYSNPIRRVESKLQPYATYGTFQQHFSSPKLNWAAIKIVL